MNENDRSQFYKRRALEARTKALTAGEPSQKAGWLELSKMWDEMAKEYEALKARRDQPPDSK